MCPLRVNYSLFFGCFYIVWVGASSKNVPMEGQLQSVFCCFYIVWVGASSKNAPMEGQLQSVLLLFLYCVGWSK